MAPVYFAMGGVIFVREHAPITLDKAYTMRAVHMANAAHWLTEDGAFSRTARLQMAKIEQSLADEMDAAIAAVRSAQPLLEAA